MSLFWRLTRLSADILRSRGPLAASMFLIGLSLPVKAAAQNVPPAPTPQVLATPVVQPLQNYSKPRSAFPHVLQSYRAQEVPQPAQGNSPRIDSLS